MNITQYNERRDELSALLLEVITCLEEIDSKYKNLDMSSLKEASQDIAAIRKKVYEDYYKIVLVAQFQGGKSTSFNAITGGSYISPMGNGSIKCSAAPVLAKSVVNESEQGVTVYMRSTKDLAELLSVSGYCDVDLTSTENVDINKAAWQEKFDIWRQNPATIFEKDDERDMFFVAGFILEFYNHPLVQGYLQKERFDISCEDIVKFAKFPNGYLVKYSEGGPSAFSAEEAVYAFVKLIDARVQSQYMAQIGASFVDAPGLLANTYDTRVTTDELVDASAVWYLLGAKAPGAAELNAIRECSKLSKDRMFFSANIKDNQASRPIWIKEVLPSIEQAVKNTVPEAKVQPYHALLALLYIHGEYFVTNGKWFDNSVTELLVERCEAIGVPNPRALSAEQCWKKLVRVCINGLYKLGLDEFDVLENSLSPEGLAIIRRESNWDGTVEAIREFVVNSKSKSILITDTSKKALELIDSLKNLLKLREQEANKSFEQTHAEYIEADEKLSGFMNDLEDSIIINLPSRKDKEIASDMYDDVFLGSPEEIAAEAAPKIFAKTGVLRIAGAAVAQGCKKTWQLFSNLFRSVPDTTPIENSYKVEINTILRNTICEVLDIRTKNWLKSTQQGNNKKFQDTITTPASNVFTEMQQKWNERCACNSILSALVPVVPPKPSVFVSGNNDCLDLSSVLRKLSFTEFVKDVCAGIISLYMCGVLIPEPAFAVVITLVFMVVRSALKEDKKIEAVKSKIIDKLKLSFLDKKADIVCELEPKVSVFREAIIKEIRKPFVVIKDRFRKAKAGALSAYMRDSIKRKQVADESKEVRETYIEGENGLEQRLLNYIMETEPLCSAESDTVK